MIYKFLEIVVIKFLIRRDELVKKFLAKFVGFAMGPIIGAFLSFLTIPITTYFIDPTEFGKASMYTVVQSFLLSIIYLGIDQAYTREYHVEKNKIKLFQNALFLPLCLAFFILFIIILFKKEVSYFLFSNYSYPYISMLFGIMVVFSIIERFILLSIRMQERAVEYSMFSVMLKLVIFIVTLVLILIGFRNFLTIIYSNIAGQIIGDSILIYRYRSFCKIQKGFIDKRLIKQLFKFGFPLVIAASLSSLLNTSSRFFLRGFSTYHELGIYTAALKISSILQIVQSAFTSFWTPTAYRWHREDKSMKHFSFVSDVLLLLMTFLYFLILFLKKYIIIVLSSEYGQAQYVAGLLSLIPILYTLSETTTLGIVFSRKSYYNIYVSIIAIIPNLCLNYLLVPVLGTIGSAIASAISYIAFCFSRTFFSNKSDFKINSLKQTLVILVFFLSGCINAFPFLYVNLFNLILLIICLFVQFSTFKEIKNVRKNPEKWNFE